MKLVIYSMVAFCFLCHHHLFHRHAKACGGVQAVAVQSFAVAQPCYQQSFAVAAPMVYAQPVFAAQVYAAPVVVAQPVVVQQNVVRAQRQVIRTRTVVRTGF